MKETEEQKMKQKEIEQQKFENENNQLIESTEIVKKNNSKYINQIEEWTFTTFDKVIFDSDYCDWKINTSTFNKHIDGNDNCAFVIEDNDGNIFGAFISERIDLKRLNEKDLFGIPINDKNAFVFTLKSNRNFEHTAKFSIKPSEIEHGFIFFKESDWILMVMGESDVVIGKEEYKANCFNNQKSYDYGTSKKVLNGKQGSNERYTVKRIQVWHFVLSEEQKKQKEEEKTRQHEMFIKTISTERDQMNILSQNIISEFQYEIHQIEEWSELKSKSVLFDSKYCDWSLQSSTFAKHILHKDKLAFLIVTETNIKYGGFIYEKAETYIYNEEIDDFEATIDPKSFVFTFKDDDPMIFYLKKEFKYKTSFFLNTDENVPELFAFGPLGYYDIWVGKKDVDPFCCQNKERSYYNFKGKKSALTGISGEKYMENQFTIKRFIVIQFQ